MILPFSNTPVHTDLLYLLSIAGYPLGIASDVLIRKYAVGHKVEEQLHNCGVGKRALSVHLDLEMSPIWA